MCLICHAGRFYGHRSPCRNGPATAGSTAQCPEWRREFLEDMIPIDDIYIIIYMYIWCLFFFPNFVFRRNTSLGKLIQLFSKCHGRWQQCRKANHQRILSYPQVNQNYATFPRSWERNIYKSYPRRSMYGIVTYIWRKCMINVGKYSIHEAYGYNRTNFIPWSFVSRCHFCIVYFVDTGMERNLGNPIAQQLMVFNITS